MVINGSARPGVSEIFPSRAREQISGPLDSISAISAALARTQPWTVITKECVGLCSHETLFTNTDSGPQFAHSCSIDRTFPLGHDIRFMLLGSSS